MGEMETHPQRVVSLEDARELPRDALRQDGRGLGTNAHDFDMRDASYPLEQPIEGSVSQRQRIASRKQHIPNLRVLGDILEAQLPALRIRAGDPVSIDPARARAVPTRDWTKVSHQQ
jgi:hypothetical protein